MVEFSDSIFMCNYSSLFAPYIIDLILIVQKHNRIFSKSTLKTFKIKITLESCLFIMSVRHFLTAIIVSNCSISQEIVK